MLKSSIYLPDNIQPSHWKSARNIHEYCGKTCNITTSNKAFNSNDECDTTTYMYEPYGAMLYCVCMYGATPRVVESLLNPRQPTKTMSLALQFECCLQRLEGYPGKHIAHALNSAIVSEKQPPCILKLLRACLWLCV